MPQEVLLLVNLVYQTPLCCQFPPIQLAISIIHLVSNRQKHSLPRLKHSDTLVEWYTIFGGDADQMKPIIAHLLYFEKEIRNQDGQFWNIGADYIYATMNKYDSTNKQNNK